MSQKENKPIFKKNFKEHMGQKDLDGYNAEKFHIFFNFGVWIHQPKTVQIKSKNM